MKIAIIGATGFLGSNLIKYLPNKYRIIATYINKKKINKKFLNKKNFKWKFLDLHKSKNFFKYLNSPDIVIHFSWSNLPNYNEIFHMKKELPYQKKFVFNLINNGLKNLFIAGTCYEYGNQSGKIYENNKEMPNTNYAKAKVLLKKFVFKLKKKYKFNLIWGRMFYVYGQHNSRTTLYNSILESAKNKKKLFVYKNIFRDYMNIDQLSKIIIKIILKQTDVGVLNICSGKSILLKNFVKKICKINNIKPKIRYIKKSNKASEANNYWGCNLKLKNLLS